MSTVLVTGGAGFIGSHLVDRLVAEGNQVIVLDNYATGRPDNLQQHKDNPAVVIHEVDIRSGQAIKNYFRGVDTVYHVAALADIVPSIVQPMDYFTTNVSGTVNVLEAARQAGVKKLVYVASSSCYGIPDVYPTPETAAILPEYPYALTKNLGEQVVMHWGKVYGLPVVSCRFFNIYGPRSRTSGTYGAVFGVFLAQKVHGQPLTIVGDGTQSRDFTFVSDAVDALVTAGKSSVAGEIFNVGSGGTYTVNQLADLLGGPRVYIPKRPGEPDCTFADTTKIQQQLHWQPKVAFADGVAVMLQHIAYWQAAPVWTQEKIQEATADWFKYLK